MAMVGKREVNTFLRNMRYFINTSEYTTSELAKMLGVNVREIQRWKRLERLPSFKNSVNFARLFKKSLEELLSKRYYR